MKVLVSDSTAATEADDFDFTVPGELLVQPAVLCDDLERRYEICQCGRSFSGLSSAKSTTVGVVAERDASDVEIAIRGAYTAEKWGASQNEYVALMLAWTEAIDEELAGVPDGASVRVRHEGDEESGYSFELLLGDEAE